MNGSGMYFHRNGVVKACWTFTKIPLLHEVVARDTSVLRLRSSPVSTEDYSPSVYISVFHLMITMINDRLRLKVLLAPNKVESRLAVHVALDVQHASEHLGTAEEDASFGGGVDLANAAEDHVPIRSAEVGR